MESPQFVVTLDGLDPSLFEVHSRKKQQTYSVTVNSPNMDSESSLVEHKEKEVNRNEGVQRKKRAASPIFFQKSEGSDAEGICFFVCVCFKHCCFLQYKCENVSVTRRSCILSFFPWTGKYHFMFLNLATEQG
jgi:hypothetical protein